MSAQKLVLSADFTTNMFSVPAESPAIFDRAEGTHMKIQGENTCDSLLTGQKTHCVDSASGVNYCYYADSSLAQLLFRLPQMQRNNPGYRGRRPREFQHSRRCSV